jgi:hypothetical protein
MRNGTDQLLRRKGEVEADMVVVRKVGREARY